MYLSAKKAQQPRSVKDHEELELLLESFAKQVEEIVSELETMTVSDYSSISKSPAEIHGFVGKFVDHAGGGGADTGFQSK